MGVERSGEGEYTDSHINRQIVRQRQRVGDGEREREREREREMRREANIGIKI